MKKLILQCYCALLLGVFTTFGNTSDPCVISTTQIELACESFTWSEGNGETYFSNTIATHTFVDENACENVITLDLTINLSGFQLDIIEACDSYTWIDGITYTESNNTASYSVTDPETTCSYLSVLDLTILESIVIETEVIEACDSYTWVNGITYYESTIAEYLTPSDNGCNYIQTLDLTINHSTTAETELVETCDSYTWINGETYYESANVEYITTNDVGCEYIQSLDLTINNGGVEWDVIEACEEYTWIDGVTYTVSNNTATYVTINDENGCNHVTMLDLTINQPTIETEVIEACEEYTWINGETYYESTSFEYETINEETGCESIITLHLTIYPYEVTDQYQACEDYFIWINGETYSESTYGETFTVINSYGCEQVLILDLDMPDLNAEIFLSGNKIETEHECMGIYQWVDCDNDYAYIDGANDMSFFPETSGNYALLLTEENCYDISDCIEFTTLNLSEEKADTPIFYTTTGGIWFDKVKNMLSVSIYDVQGRFVAQKSFSSPEHWDLSYLPAGMYLIQIENTKTKSIYTDRLIFNK